MYRIGIDLGGTKIEGISLDATGRELRRVRIASPQDDYRRTIDAIASVVRDLESNLAEEASVGVGIPGTISRATGRVKNANSTWLNGEALAEDVEAALGRPVRLANDANCFTLSEATDGAAAGADVVFGVILGTGCGGGIAVHQRVITGPNAVAGEWGHNPLPWPRDDEWPGRTCYCGRTGCIETFLSGPGLAHDYVARGGDRLDATEIVRRLDTGRDPLAEVSLERYEDRLARALTSIIHVLDPDVIVLGGGVSNVARLYRNVPPLLRLFGGDAPRTRLVQAAHGDSSGVRGAAWLWNGPESRGSLY
ncbi:MAG: ROK family protein [Acidobacteriota bacterium]|nr:ROK family protein [Acidobacteriota bacterium]